MAGNPMSHERDQGSRMTSVKISLMKYALTVGSLRPQSKAPHKIVAGLARQISEQSVHESSRLIG